MKLSFVFWAFAVAIAPSSIAPSAAHASDQENIFDQVTGSWVASGNSFGLDVKSEMIWTKTLDGQFYRIDYRINMNPASDKTFTGIGHYQATESNTTAGYWADNSGDLHPLKVTVEKDAILSIWGGAGGKQGRTEYRLVGEGRMWVTDWLLTEDGWRQFNEASFARKPS